MSQTSKQLSERDANQVLKGAFNDVDKSLTTAGFVVGKVGHKIEVLYPSASTEQFDYYDGATLLYTILVTYTDGTKANIQSVERTV